MQILDIAAFPVVDDVEMSFRNFGVVDDDVAGRISADHRNRFCGEVDLRASSSSRNLPDQRNGYEILAFAVALFANYDFVVEFNDGTFESFAADENFGFEPVGRKVLDVPDTVFAKATELFGRDERRLDDKVARAFGTDYETVFGVAVEEIVEFAVSDFYDDVVHCALPCVVKILYICRALKSREQPHSEKGF